MTTDFDQREPPVVFAAGELEPAPSPRGRRELIGRLAMILLAGVTAVGALAAVASWSVTGSVGSTDPPRSLWYLPPAATEEAINLSDNHPAPVTIPAAASSGVPVDPTLSGAEDHPKVGDDNQGASGSGGEGHGSGSGDDVSGEPGGSGSSGSGGDNSGGDDPTQVSGGAADDRSGSPGGKDDSPSSVAAGSEPSVAAQDVSSPTADSGSSGSGSSGGSSSGGGGSGSGSDRSSIDDPGSNG